jgi:hypothetical protein
VPFSKPLQAEIGLRYALSKLLAFSGQECPAPHYRISGAAGTPRIALRRPCCRTHRDVLPAPHLAAAIQEAPGFAVFFILTVKSFFGVRRGTVFVAQANVYPTVPGEGIRGSS